MYYDCHTPSSVTKFPLVCIVSYEFRIRLVSVVLHFSLEMLVSSSGVEQVEHWL